MASWIGDIASDLMMIIMIKRKCSVQRNLKQHVNNSANVLSVTAMSACTKALSATVTADLRISLNITILY